MTKKIIISIFLSLVVLIGAAVAVLVAFKQNTEKPVAPTVPQVTPQAATPSATPACTLAFTVAAAQEVVCDSLELNPTSGDSPLTTTLTLTGHTNGGGSIVNYKFDFGDGTAPVGQVGNKITHTYASQGNYIVKGTVTDDKGNTAGGIGNCLKTLEVVTKTYKYNVCANNACKQQDCVPKGTPCSGLSTCQKDDDCKLKVISPPPPPPPPLPPAATQPTHKECRNRSCIVVTGAGTDSCTSDVSCQPIAAPPPIPKAGNTMATLGAIILGVGALIAGILILL